ncbi:MAG TPA: serine/threonine-protein kinase, partial [Steroidobacteraceae bacterium]|nr:serine/threonine-protein kinase [Steroidobacteraceae bacterium]
MMQAPNLEAIAQRASAALKASYIRPLAAGAFKSAHLVTLADRSYALKVAALGPNSQARVERECDAQRSCSHPAIAKMEQSVAFSENGANYWVWIEEFLPGGTLEARRGVSVLAPETVRSFAVPMIGALDHLAARKLVHRDIKPANIIFRSDTEPVLTDFGIVRALDLPTLTHHFMMQGPGTPAYAAAEQLNNEIALIDWRTDQFGLAVVLSECLLGHHPFAPEKDVQAAISRVAARAAVPSATQKGLEGAGFSALLRALAPWPHQRYRTPIEFLNSM